jgi:hypothetical protein
MMMRALCIPLVALLALAAALAPSASAHEFVTSTTGRVRVRSITPQIFEAGGVVVECTGALETINLTTPLKSETLDVPELGYGGCTEGGQPVTVSDGDYQFKANGTVSLEQALTITVNDAECTIVFSAAANKALEGVSFANVSPDLHLVQELTTLDYTGSGGVCETGGEGTLAGALILEFIDGGTIEWK